MNSIVRIKITGRNTKRFIKQFLINKNISYSKYKDISYKETLLNINYTDYLKLINNKSFLVNTVERITPLIKKDNIYVVTNKDYLEKIRDELSDVNSENIFTEPANKETAMYSYLGSREWILNIAKIT